MPSPLPALLRLSWVDELDIELGPHEVKAQADLLPFHHLLRSLASPRFFVRLPLIQINAGICRDLAKGITEHCPNAFVLVISNPVNSTVPVFAEVFKAAGTYDAKKSVHLTLSPFERP